MATAKEVLAQGARLAGEDEAVMGSNNTTVNRYFGVTGDAGPYCGYFLWWAARQAGSGIFDGCSNPAYVPTVKAFFAGRKVPNDSARPGDIFAYKDQHVGFVYEPVGGTTVLTLEGNAPVYRTLAEARRSAAGSGAYEGIGYRKRVLDGSYTLYRPAYGGSGTGPEKTPKEYVKEWQTWLGVQADGIWGPKTRDALVRTMLLGYLEKYPLRTGMKGDAVKAAQGLLYARGYDPDGLDGSYGPGMTRAVRACQEGAAGLTVDGVLGVATFKALVGWT